MMKHLTLKGKGWCYSVKVIDIILVVTEYINDFPARLRGCTFWAMEHFVDDSQNLARIFYITLCTISRLLILLHLIVPLSKWVHM